MRVELLASTIEDGKVLNKQHLACLVVNDRVTIDAGSLSFSTSQKQRKQIRDVVLTHAHIDHIAGLPLFIDDHFSELETPVNVYASSQVVEILEKHIFNWEIYPDFTELENDFGEVLRLISVEEEKHFEAAGLRFFPAGVNHKVPAHGYIVSDEETSFAVTGDTAEIDSFWETLSETKALGALFIECAFPNELDELAVVSHHLTPKRLASELRKFRSHDCPIYVINIKPVHREAIVRQLLDQNIPNLQIMDIGRDYVI